jgi:hypothetical protein
MSELSNELTQRMRSNQANASDQLCFAYIGWRHVQRLRRAALCETGDGERSAHRADGPIERELTNRRQAIGATGRELTRGDEEA